MIRAIIFDVGGVLATTILENMASYLAKKHNMEFAFVNREIRRRLDEYKVAKISAAEFWQSFKESAGMPEPAEELSNLALEYIKPKHGMDDILKKLRKSYKIGLVSNSTNEWTKKVRQIIDINIFDAAVFSNEAKTAKPGKEIFGICLKKLNLLPEECIFIDDQENNISAAKKMGFNTIRFEDQDKLKIELGKFGVKI